MKLITFGCSFIHGDELIPDTTEYKNKHNLGGVIYNNYQFDDYINYGSNGASNERIIFQILEYLNSDDYSTDDFIVVGLTGLQRTLTYINESKTPLTIPHWDFECHIENTNHGLLEYDGIKEYFDSKLKFEINDRNEILRYFTNCMTIKSLLSSFKRYFIFQSVDYPNLLFSNIERDDSWAEIVIDKQHNDRLVGISSNIVYNKTTFINTLKSNLSKNQLWNNLDNDSYQNFINKNEKYKKGQHPSELGAQKFFELSLKKYLDFIL